MTLPKAYNPSDVEDKIYQAWEKSGFFNPDKLPGKRKKTFTISMPPPNATGQLHMGHAAMLALQDIMTRYHRMKGDAALWLPGTDHASIATQNKVEKILLEEENKTRQDLGRAKFLKKVDAYVKDSQHIIKRQVRKMGSSCDWSRERYTLDAGLTSAVQEVFVRMYNDGLIYRGNRIVNWCPRCASTLADDEVDHKEAQAKLYTFKYSDDFPIAISTTRPETKLGDTALAVNPTDRRYKKFIGQTFKVNFLGQSLTIKVIGDADVDKKFGTGALGVTPAHSTADFDLAEKHGLPVIKIIGEDGKMTSAAGKFVGMTTLSARIKVVAQLKKHGLIIKQEEISHNLSQCYRCDTVIEPLTSRQWFIDVNKVLSIKNQELRKTVEKKEASLKEIANAVVEKGAIKIIPDRFNKTYFHWMNNLRDWCISRQIWFGHRIPVYYKQPEKPVDITYFVHGATVDNETGKSTGHADIPLSDLGKKQAYELKELTKDKKFDIVFCSDLKRAADTAKATFGNRGIKIIKDKRLREIDYGQMTRKSTKIVDPNKTKSIHQPFPKGESYKDVESRINDFLADIIDKYAGKRVAIVAHHAPQLAIEVITKNKTWQQAFADDWQNDHSWKPGWEYKLTELTSVSREPIKGWTQDPDTLDTWFSSGLWTFSTLGWPDATDDLKRFHPTSVMETGYDILFFWVARMILMTTYTLGEVPFKTVYLHGMVRDKQGRKMSKSLGNGIDPLEMIKKYGADAVRLSLIIGTTPGNDTRLYEEKIAGYRNFVNKIWNISRFIIARSTNTDHVILSDSEGSRTLNMRDSSLKLRMTISDKWILFELNGLIKRVNKYLDNYQFSLAGEDIYDFMWHKFADWYVEATKVEAGEHQGQILTYVLEKCLIMLHPFIPFVTEFIWSKISTPPEISTPPMVGAPSNLLIVEPWVDKIDFDITLDDVKKFEKVQEVISAIRNARAEHKIPAGDIINCAIDAKQPKLIKDNQKLIEKLARVKITTDSATVIPTEAKTRSAGSKRSGGIPLTLSHTKIIIEKTVKTVSTKDQADIKKYIKSLEARLKNKDFLSKAPPEVIKKEKARLKEMRAKLGK